MICSWQVLLKCARASLPNPKAANNVLPAVQQAAGRGPGDQHPEPWQGPEVPQERQQQALHAQQQQSPGRAGPSAAQGAQHGVPGHGHADPIPGRRAAAEWQQQQLVHMHQALQRRQLAARALAEGQDPGAGLPPAPRAGAELLGGGLWGTPYGAQHATRAPPGFAIAPVLERPHAASLQQQAAALAAGYSVGQPAAAEVQGPCRGDCLMLPAPACLLWCCFL